MKSFNLLFVHEIHKQFKSFKFITMLMLAFIVSLSVSFVRINDYKEKYTTYQDEVKRSEEKLKNVQVYSELEVPVFVTPDPLSIFALGIDDKAGNKAVVSATHYPGVESTSQKANPFLNLFTSIDIVGIVKLFSVFIILMAAGAIAGEREDNTLKMIFATNVGRIEFFLAKYLAFGVVILCSIIIIFIIPVLMIITDNQIATSSTFIPGVCMLLLTSLMYLSVFILLSLLVSAKMATTTQAVLTTLFIWVGITYIYPQITTTISRSIYKTPSKVELNSRIKRIDYELKSSGGNYMLNNQPRRSTNTINGNTFDTREGGREGWIGNSKIGLTQKFSFEFYRDFNNVSLNGLWERHRTVRSLEDTYNKPLFRQASLFNTLNILMPDIIYTQLAEKLAGTDRKQREEQFRDAIYNYRDLLMDYMRSKDGLGYPFFTQTTEDKMKDDFNAYTSEDREKAFNMAPLDVSDIPEFNFHTRSDPYMDIIVLIVLNFILMMIGGMLFYKSKIL